MLVIGNNSLLNPNLNGFTCLDGVGLDGFLILLYFNG
jgi:hypothetical protein